MSKVMLDGIPPTQTDNFLSDIDNGVENLYDTKRPVEEHFRFSFGVQIDIPPKPPPIKAWQGNIIITFLFLFVYLVLLSACVWREGHFIPFFVFNLILDVG